MQFLFRTVQVTFGLWFGSNVRDGMISSELAQWLSALYMPVNPFGIKHWWPTTNGGRSELWHFECRKWDGRTDVGVLHPVGNQKDKLPQDDNDDEDDDDL